MSKAAIETAPKYDRIGKITYMVRSGGYVMVRRPYNMPFIMTEKEWGKLPTDPAKAEGQTVTCGRIIKDPLPSPQENKQ